MPATREEFAAALHACERASRTALFFGGGTLQGIGALPARYDLALATARLARIVAHEPRDLTIALEAGVTLAALQARLAAVGQFVPLDGPQAARGTIGGLLASGWLGPRRARYGSPRDLVIGTTVALSDGTLARSGGMVVKNATGYDLSKLHLGALGSLGAIVQANLRTLPLPATQRLALAPLPEGSGARTLAHLAHLELEPSAALVVRGFTREIAGTRGPDGLAFVLLEGSRALVERATRELRSALGAAGVPQTFLVEPQAEIARHFAQLLEAPFARLGARSLTYRFAGAPDDLATRGARCAALAGEFALTLETFEDARTGDLFARLGAPNAAALAERAPGFDTARLAISERLQLIAAPDRLRAKLSAWGTPPAALATMRALKAHLDPNGTLASARLAGGL